jgi:hypothetical protein
MRSWWWPDQPVNPLKMGPSLVRAGYTQTAILNASFFLQSQKRIELLEERNAVRLLLWA